MNGKRYLLDTNAIVQLLAGNKELAGIVRGADFLATSVVCQFEFLSYPGLTEPDARLYAEFASRIHTFSVPADDAHFREAAECPFPSVRVVSLDDFSAMMQAE